MYLVWRCVIEIPMPLSEINNNWDMEDVYIASSMLDKESDTEMAVNMYHEKEMKNGS